MHFSDLSRPGSVLSQMANVLHTETLLFLGLQPREEKELKTNTSLLLFWFSETLHLATTCSNSPATHFLLRWRATSDFLKPSRLKRRLARRLAAATSAQRLPLVSVSLLPRPSLSLRSWSSSESVARRALSLLREEMDVMQVDRTGYEQWTLHGWLPSWKGGDKNNKGLEQLLPDFKIVLLTQDARTSDMKPGHSDIF